MEMPATVTVRVGVGVPVIVRVHHWQRFDFCLLGLARVNSIFFQFLGTIE